MAPRTSASRVEWVKSVRSVADERGRSGRWRVAVMAWCGVWHTIRYVWWTRTVEEEAESSWVARWDVVPKARVLEAVRPSDRDESGEGIPSLTPTQPTTRCTRESPQHLTACHLSTDPQQPHSHLITAETLRLLHVASF